MFQRRREILVQQFETRTRPLATYRDRLGREYVEMCTPNTVSSATVAPHAFLGDRRGATRFVLLDEKSPLVVPALWRQLRHRRLLAAFQSKRNE